MQTKPFKMMSIRSGTAGPNVHRLAIPNPFFEGRNSVYVIEAEALTLIDTGVATTKAFDHLVQGLKQLGFAPQDVAQVVLTHKHIDHIGNAWRFQQLAGSMIWIHESEVRSVRDVDPAGGRFRELMFDRMREWQVPEGHLPDAESDSMPRWELEPAQAVAIQDGDAIDLGQGHTLEVIHTPGHSMGSVCLRVGESLFTGDHVLPTISPNVGAGDLRQRGMLGNFLQSLERVSKYDGLESFPGHGLPFNGLAERCDELRRHHLERLERVRTILASRPKTVYEVALELFGALEGVHVLLGCAEANAHLEWLVDHREVVETAGRFSFAH